MTDAKGGYWVKIWVPTRKKAEYLKMVYNSGYTVEIEIRKAGEVE